MTIINIPNENGLGHTVGCRLGPEAILGASKEIYSKEDLSPVNFEKIDSVGVMCDLNDPEKTNDVIYKKAFSEFEKNGKTFFLGGDHSVSYPLVRAFFDSCENNSKEPCLIVFDAHPDLMEPVDNKFPTHEEWLRGLIDDGFPAENILLVGVRNSDIQESKFIKNKGIRMISINRFLENLENTCEVMMEFSFGKELYVSMDIDCIDPAYAPGTYYCEPGGFTSREFVYLVQRINKMKNLRAVDIVEVNPKRDVNGLTVKLAAKILSELL